MEVCETISGGIWQVLRGKTKENNIEKNKEKTIKIRLDTIKYY